MLIPSGGSDEREGVQANPISIPLAQLQGIAEPAFAHH
jgi:hypothetical protein